MIRFDHIISYSYVSICYRQQKSVDECMRSWAEMKSCAISGRTECDRDYYIGSSGQIVKSEQGKRSRLYSPSPHSLFPFPYPSLPPLPSLKVGPYNPAHTYAVKSPLVTMARPKFSPKYPLPSTDPQTPPPASSLDPSDL